MINQLNNVARTSTIVLFFCGLFLHQSDRSNVSKLHIRKDTIKIIDSPCKSWLLKRSETESINVQSVQSIVYILYAFPSNTDN